VGQIKGSSFSPDTRDRDSPEINLLASGLSWCKNFYFSSYFLSITFDSTKRKIKIFFILFVFEEIAS
jgi:hypothetical protein